MEVIQGADFSISATFVNRSNSAIDLYGCTARVMLKEDISDPDDEALVHLLSTSASSSFDFGNAVDGKIVVTVNGNYTASLEIDKKLKTYAQVEAQLDGHYYRTPNLQIDIAGAVFNS
jgi:hypothetical protein